MTNNYLLILQKMQKKTSLIILLLLAFASVADAQFPFAERKKWDGPYDIRMIAAPNLEPVYLNETQAKSGILKVDSLITYTTMMMSGTQLDINNRYKGGSPFVFNTKLTAPAVLCPDINVPCDQGIPVVGTSSSCPVKYEKPANSAYTLPGVYVSLTYPDYDTDMSTFSSSMAELDISKCAEIEAAYLYWAGKFQGGPNITLFTPTNSYDGTSHALKKDVFKISSTSGFEKIKFKIPGGGYQDVTALTKYVSGNSYVCVSDITNMVKGTGPGQFWAGNIQSYPNESDGGSSSGWVLVVVFRSPKSPPRVISLFDGYENINGGSKDFKLTGLTAPTTSNFKSYIGFAVLDGENIYQEGVDQPESLEFQTNNGGPKVELNPNRDDRPHYRAWKDGSPADIGRTVLVDACKYPDFTNPAWATVYDGVSSQKITSYDEKTGKNGAEITRLPSNPITLGFDAHHMLLPDKAIAPGATEANLKLYSGPQGGLSSYMAYIAIERLQPKLEMEKFADKNSSKLNAEITYTLRIKNAGNYISEGNDNIYDTLDIATDFVPGSITSISYKNGVQAAGTVTLTSSTDNKLELKLVQKIEAGDSLDIVFKVKVKPASGNDAIYKAQCKRKVENTAYIIYNIIGGTLSSKSNANDCGIGSQTSVSLVDPIELASAIFPQATVEACSFKSDTIVSRMKTELLKIIPAGDKANIDKYEIRDSTYERVHPDSIFRLAGSPVTYIAIRNYASGGGSGTCEEVYKIPFECAACKPPTALTLTPDPLTACEGTTQALTADYTLGTPKNGNYYVTFYKSGTPLPPAVILPAASTTITDSLRNLTAAMSGTYKVRIEDGNNADATCYKEDSITVTVTPSLVKGDIGSDQSLCGSAAAPATPAGLTSVAPASGGSGTVVYEWEQSTTGGAAAWAAVSPAATTPAYTPSALNTTTYFRRKATAGTECPAVYADSVKITINDFPAAPTPVSGLTPACPNSTLTIGAAPSGITYYWQGIKAGKGDTLKTNPAITALIVSTSGTYYVRAKDNSTHCWSDTTGKYIQIDALTAGTIAAAETVCQGINPTDITSLTPASGAGTLSYSWETSSDSTTWSAVAGTVEFYNFAAPITASTYYRRKVTSTSGCANYTGGIKKTYSQLPDPAGTISGLATVCAGKTGEVYSIATVPYATSYTWTVPAGATITSGATTKSITVSFGTSTGDITVTPVNSCGNGTDATLNVTVNPIPVATVSGTNTICSGEKTAIGVSSDVSGTTYTWTMAVTPVGAATGSASGTVANDAIEEVLTSSGAVTGVAKYTVTPLANGCPGTPKDFSVTVNPAPVITGATSGLCSGESTGILPVSNINPTTYTWSATASSPAITGHSDETTGKTSITQTLLNSGSTNGTVTYTVTPVANCQGTPKQFVVTVTAVPVATPASAEICSGTATNIALTTTPATSATFEWPLPVSATVTGAQAGTAASAIAQTLATTQATSQIITFKVTPVANGCKGNSIDVPVTVYPMPVSNAGFDASYCVGDTALIGIAIANPAYAYSWSPATDLSSNTSSGPRTWATVTTTYTVTTGLIANPLCQTTDDVLINVSPKFTVDAGEDLLICAKERTALKASPTDLVSYVWSNGATGHSIQVAPEDTTVYILRASNGGCEAIDTVIINIKNIAHPTLYIPNAFSPNNDGFNDVFKVEAEGVVEFEGMIFNRWGEKFFEWFEVEGGWDGTLPSGKTAQGDVYIYHIKVKNLCDKRFNAPRSGTLTIIAGGK